MATCVILFVLATGKLKQGFDTIFKENIRAVASPALETVHVLEAGFVIRKDDLLSKPDLLLFAPVHFYSLHAIYYLSLYIHQRIYATENIQGKRCCLVLVLEPHLAVLGDYLSFCAQKPFPIELYETSWDGHVR